MEVHPPHHPLNTWRDFFIHIATITIGLLIAIGLEQSVEMLHHRHLRHATVANLNGELRDNADNLKLDLAAFDRERQELQANIATLRQLRAGQPVAPGSLHFNWYWSSSSETAFQTARETGALALLPNDEAQSYAFVYAQQAHVDLAGVALARSITQAAIPLTIEPELTKLSPSLVDELMRNNASALNDLDYLTSLTDTLQQDYKHVLPAL